MKIPENKIKSLRQTLNAKAKESDGISLTFTAYKQGEERGIKLIEKGDVKNLANINKLLVMDNFVRIKIDMFDLNISDSKPEKTYEYTDETLGFSGFGQVSETERSRVNELLNIHLKEQDYQKLKIENEQLINRVDELENDLDEAEEVIEQMQEKIKSQQGLKTYAELAGIALDRLGFRNQVKSALAGFLGDESSEEDTPPTMHIENDQSGIVETPQPAHDRQPQPQNEIIELINLCLKSMDNTTLGVVFSIFSEIEKNHALALQILATVNKYNACTNIQNPTNNEQKNEQNHEQDHEQVSV